MRLLTPIVLAGLKIALSCTVAVFVLIKTAGAEPRSSQQNPLSQVATANVIAQAPASAPPDPNAPPVVSARIAYLSKSYPVTPPLSLLDKVLTDEGIQGARVAVKENNMTGRLIGHHHDLVETLLPADGDVASAAKKILADGHRLIIADLEFDDLSAVTSLPEAANAIIINVRLSDDELRQEDCKDNLFHLPPSWAMRADALAQYLVWKKWTRWFVISGKSPRDQQYLAAVKAAAKKFASKIVEEKFYTYDAGSRRTDSGHQQIQTQMPLLTQAKADYDVIFVTDPEEAFGDYLLFRTFLPRPVVGSQGLMAVGWHRSFEQYAGTQMQNRFERAAKRWMTERDYYAWLAVRIFGEAVLRTGTADPDKLKAYILSKEFEVAGFKGQGMTFRSWDHQLRQPILLSGPRALVSISPQDGFLHQKFHTDTLGIDQPETKCQINK